MFKKIFSRVSTLSRFAAMLSQINPTMHQSSSVVPRLCSAKPRQPCMLKFGLSRNDNFKTFIIV